MRILIAGYPNTGKGDIASRLQPDLSKIFRTDELLHFPVNQHIKADMLAMRIDQMQAGDVIKGTLIWWGLRRWLEVYADGKKSPCDLLIDIRSEPNTEKNVLGLCKAIDSVRWEVLNHPKWNPYLRPLNCEMRMW